MYSSQNTKVIQTIYILNKYKLDSTSNNNKYNANNNTNIIYDKILNFNTELISAKTGDMNIRKTALSF